MGERLTFQITPISLTLRTRFSFSNSFIERILSVVCFLMSKSLLSLDCRSMKKLDKSHILITEKLITRKLIRAGWKTGEYLKDWQTQVKYIYLMLPVRFSQSPGTIKINFLAVKFINRLKSTSFFLTLT